MLGHFKSLGKQLVQVIDTSLNVKGTAAIGAEKVVVVVQAGRFVTHRSGFQFHGNQISLFDTLAQ